MLHQVSGGIAEKQPLYVEEDAIELNKRLQATIAGIICSRTKITDDQLSRNWDRRNWWLNSEEAIELGLAHALYK